MIFVTFCFELTNQSSKHLSKMVLLCTDSIARLSSLNRPLGVNIDLDNSTLLRRSERVVVPKALQQDIKQRIHSSHMGAESCLRCVWECVFGLITGDYFSNYYLLEWEVLMFSVTLLMEFCDLMNYYVIKGFA